MSSSVGTFIIAQYWSSSGTGCFPPHPVVLHFFVAPAGPAARVHPAGGPLCLRKLPKKTTPYLLCDVTMLYLRTPDTVRPPPHAAARTVPSSRLRRCGRGGGSLAQTRARRPRRASSPSSPSGTPPQWRCRLPRLLAATAPRRPTECGASLWRPARPSPAPAHPRQTPAARASARPRPRLPQPD